MGAAHLAKGPRPRSSGKQAAAAPWPGQPRTRVNPHATDKVFDTRRVSTLTIHPTWRPSSIQPHLSEKFKLLTDARFVLSPAQNVLAICVAEKREAQALDRTHSVMPMRMGGQVARRTRAEDSHGTTTLFARSIEAVTARTDVKPGALFAKYIPRHRTQEFRAFLEEVKRNLPEILDIHIVLDNPSSDKTEWSRRWVAKPPHRRTNSAPTSSSRINQVERFFVMPAAKQIGRGVYSSGLIKNTMALISKRKVDLTVLPVPCQKMTSPPRLHHNTSLRLMHRINAMRLPL